MESSWWYRVVLIVGLIGLALYYSAPSYIYFSLDPEDRRKREKIEEQIPDWMPEHRFNLGIDLQGGLHLVMGVDTEKAVQARADRAGDEIVEAAGEEGVKLKRVWRPDVSPELEITMETSDDWAKLKTVLDRYKGSWDVKGRFDDKVVFGMNSSYESSLREDSVEQALKTLRNRIDEFGVTEPEVRKRGDNSILIQIAGLTAEDEDIVKKEIIGKTAQLEFKIVDDTNSYFADVAAKPDKPEWLELRTDSYRGKDDAQIMRPFLSAPAADGRKKELKEYLKKYPPPADRVVGIQDFQANQAAGKELHTWLLERRTPITGDSLVNAFVAFDNDENNYYTAMKFDRKGAVVFERLTRENTKRKMAIVLDDLVDSSPIIEGPIPNGNARITLGGFKSQEEILADAKALSIVLKAGALPAPVATQEQRTVGATLGDDAVEKGKEALLYALIAVVIMITIYYRVSGAIGVFALSVNVLFLFSVLARFDATLTLPGIAGLALTIGMAVDANIIQFERIREELRLGKTARAAVDSGFDKAFSAIFDANVTTLLAAIVLYQYGSGPIRGFATTLGVGVVINTFTAVVVPRLCLDYLTRGRRVQELSI